MPASTKPQTYGSYDPMGDEKFEIFSATGEPRTEADYRQAWVNYNKGEPTPGFTVLQSGTLQHMLRSGFETANDLARRGAEGVGNILGKGALLAGAGMATGLNALGVPAKTAVGMAAPEAVTTAKVSEAAPRMVQASVNTPEKAGFMAGMAAASPLLAPVSVAGGTGAAALRLGALADNMFITGLMGAAGSETGRLSTGGQPFTPFQILTEFNAAAAQGGVNGLLTHALDKYIAPTIREKVLGDVRDVITKKYPQYASDPSVFDAAASNAQNLEKMVQVGVKGLQESNDTAFNAVKTAIQQRAPSSLPRAVASNMRGYTDNLQELSTDFLNATGDTAKQRLVLSKINVLAQDMEKALITAYNGATSQAQRNSISDMFMAVQKHVDTVRTGTEGATVLKALQDGMTNRGFDTNKFAEAIRQSYLGKGPLLQSVGEAVDARGLQDLSGGKLAKAANYMLDRIPFLGKTLHIPTGPTPSVLPWQIGRTGLTLNAGAALAGQSALRSFTGRDITQSTENQPVGLQEEGRR